jgi:hypothetical protein
METEREQLRRETEEIRWRNATIDAYEPVPDSEDWRECPKCMRRPRAWVFDNGRYAKCQCGEKYSAAEVQAESIVAFMKRNGGSLLGYDSDELRLNWNKYIGKL